MREKGRTSLSNGPHDTDPLDLVPRLVCAFGEVGEMGDGGRDSRASGDEDH